MCKVRAFQNWLGIPLGLGAVLCILGTREEPCLRRMDQRQAWGQELRAFRGDLGKEASL